MDFDSIFAIETDLNCSETMAYGDHLYNSPAYSDDSGFGQGFSLDDILLSDALPPSQHDEEFTESLKTLDRTDSVSSSIHDHSYFNSNIYQQQQENPDKDVSKISLKRPKSELSDLDSKQSEIPLKKCKSNKELQPNSDISVIQCDNEMFSYKDENGKVVVVDRNRKNAEMAKLNRQRKKRYISNLESEVKSLKGRNEKLLLLKNQHEKKISNLENEVAYLMSVIRNQTKLSSVLKAVSSVSGVSFPNENKQTMVQRLPGKRAPVDIADDEDYTGGVCLHVSNNIVSLEFCATCNKNQKK